MNQSKLSLNVSHTILSPQSAIAWTKDPIHWSLKYVVLVYGVSGLDSVVRTTFSCSLSNLSIQFSASGLMMFVVSCVMSYHKKKLKIGSNIYLNSIDIMTTHHINIPIAVNITTIRLVGGLLSGCSGCSLSSLRYRLPRLSCSRYSYGSILLFDSVCIIMMVYLKE